MLVTRDFVILNNPKTGSSFVRECLKKIHANRQRSLTYRISSIFRSSDGLEELILPNLKKPNASADQHGTYAQIPNDYKGRSVISVLRNPYTKLLSGYNFRHWERHPSFDLGTLKKHFPEFPNLSLDQYIDYLDLAARSRVGYANGIGIQTIQFIQMFFKEDLDSVIPKLNESYIGSGKFVDDMGAIEFLQQEDLNNQFADLLSSFSYSKAEVDFARNYRKVNITSDENSIAELTEKASNYAAHNERYLFLMLSYLGFEYKPFNN